STCSLLTFHTHTPPTAIYTLSLHDALPISFNVTTRKPTFTTRGSAELSYGNYGYIQAKAAVSGPLSDRLAARLSFSGTQRDGLRSEEHTSELQSRENLVCRLLLEKKKERRE